MNKWIARGVFFSGHLAAWMGGGIYVGGHGSEGVYLLAVGMACSVVACRWAWD